MTMHNRRARRGQPVVALGLLLVAWGGARSLVWASTHSAEPAVQERADQVAGRGAPPVAALSTNASPTRAESAPPRLIAAPPTRFVPVTPPVWPSEPNSVPQLAPPGPTVPAVAASQPTGPVSPRIAGGHQLLWMAALAQLPMPDMPQSAKSGALSPLPVQRQPRWSADGWLLLRRGGNAFNLPGAGLPGAGLPSGTYGASQAGAVIRYRLAPSSPHRPAIYLRGTTALQSPRGEEVALGLSLRPVPKLPVAALIEGRGTRTLSGTIVRPAAALVSELPPVDLPLGLRGEAYVQGGYVGGRDATAFVDGQARLEHKLFGAGRWQLRAGGGAWGGAQKGARRLDVGPTATLDLPLGTANGRLSADWRFRVDGNAAPSSGPALTLSAGF